MYIATKFAVQGLTRDLSRELVAGEITVNNGRRGPIHTALSPEDGPYAEVMKKQPGRGVASPALMQRSLGPSISQLTSPLSPRLPITGRLEDHLSRPVCLPERV